MQQLELAANSVLLWFGHRYKNLDSRVYHPAYLNYANVIECDGTIDALTLELA